MRTVTSDPETRLRFEGFTVGQRIKAFDFEPCPGRRDRYVEGVIVEIRRTPAEFENEGYAHYVIECDIDEGQSGRRVGKRVRIPMETTLDYDERVSAVTLPEPDPDYEDDLTKLARISETALILLGHAAGGGVREEAFAAVFDDSTHAGALTTIDDALDEMLDKVRERIAAHHTGALA